MSTLIEHGNKVKNTKTIKLVIRPRLHLGLISMHKGGIRKNGGIGFSTKNPSGTLIMIKAREFCFEDQRTIPFDSIEIIQLYHFVESVFKKCSFDSHIHVELRGDLRTHAGMGSGTAVRLGILEGLFRINERQISRDVLVRKSERGGTSGIGINTYFSGGLVLDLGVPNNNDEFVPSSLGFRPPIPLNLPRVVMPNWPICLCVPRSIPTKSQKQEIEFFSRAAPIDAMDSYKAAYESIFGIYASAVEGDYRSFCRSISALQETAWKSKEWREYGSEIRELETKLLEFGASAVGLSSLGPLLYCFGGSATLDRIARAEEFLNCNVVKTIPCNSGRQIVFK